MKDFNLIAGIYDRLKRAVFGKRLDRASRSFIDRIGPEDCVLILGGGTGEILSAIKAKQIIFLDNSPRMVQRAKNRTHLNTVFVTQDFLKFASGKQFDWVICSFFLDVFPTRVLPDVCLKIRGHLSPSGCLLVTDFQVRTFFQKGLLFIMYSFFILTTQIRHFRIPHIHQTLTEAGFEEKEHRYFMRSFIFSRIYTL